MAANLNPPSHYLSQTGLNAPVMGLIPPSEFEKPKPEDPWQALGRATNEILELKQQNQRLSDNRSVTLPVGEEIKARVAVHHADQNHQHQHSSRTLETVINHQAEEIVTLKKQLAQTESANQKHASRLENQLMLKDSQHLQELTMLKSEHESLRERYEAEKAAAESFREKLMTEQNSALSNLKLQLETVRQERDCEVTKLQSDLSLAQSDSKERLEELNLKEQSFDLKMAAQKQSLQQMKVYLQQSEETFKSTEIWRKEVENLKHQLQFVKEENTELRKESELLAVRLKSQNEIMAIQEQELSRLSDSFPEKKKQALLTVWRNKVYELMVQLKCSVLTEKDTERRWTVKVANYETGLSSSKARCELLQHSLHDRQAELDMERQQVAKLRRDLSQADEVAVRLDASRKETEAVLRGLVQFAESLAERCDGAESQVKAASTALNSYNQRIAFASGRVEMLQSQFARREALLRIQAEEETAQLAKPEQEEPVRDVEEEEEDGSVLQQLLDELEKVTAERDRLAAQLKADSEMMHGKIAGARTQTAGELSELKERLGELHHALEEKSEECDSLAAGLAAANHSVDESRATIDSLQSRLEEATTHAEKDVEDARKEVEQKLVEQLAEAEHKINEARREQTKEIVKVRQMERQMARDKERATAHAQKIETYYKEQTQKLEQKVKGVERDRNLLLNTIRQEGLLTKYQSLRGTPRQLDSDDDDTEPILGEQSPARETDQFLITPSNFEETQKDEPLHEVIDDLKKLAATVLDDDEEPVLE